MKNIWINYKDFFSSYRACCGGGWYDSACQILKGDNAPLSINLDVIPGQVHRMRRSRTLIKTFRFKIWSVSYPYSNAFLLCQHWYFYARIDRITMYMTHMKNIYSFTIDFNTSRNVNLRYICVIRNFPSCNKSWEMHVPAVCLSGKFAKQEYVYN